MDGVPTLPLNESDIEDLKTFHQDDSSLLMSLPYNDLDDMGIDRELTKEIRQDVLASAQYEFSASESASDDDQEGRQDHHHHHSHHHSSSSLSHDDNDNDDDSAEEQTYNTVKQQQNRNKASDNIPKYKSQSLQRDPSITLPTKVLPKSLSIFDPSVIAAGVPEITTFHRLPTNIHRRGVHIAIMIVICLFFTLWLSFPQPEHFNPGISLQQFNGIYAYNLPVYTQEQQSAFFTAAKQSNSLHSLRSSSFWYPQVGSFPVISTDWLPSVFRAIQRKLYHSSANASPSIPTNTRISKQIQAFFEHDTQTSLLLSPSYVQEELTTSLSSSIPSQCDSNLLVTQALSEYVTQRHLVDSSSDSPSASPRTYILRLSASTTFSLYADIQRFLHSVAIFPTLNTDFPQLYLQFLHALAIIQHNPTFLTQNNDNNNDDSVIIPKIVLVFDSITLSTYQSLLSIYTDHDLNVLSLHGLDFQTLSNLPTFDSSAQLAQHNDPAKASHAKRTQLYHRLKHFSTRAQQTLNGLHSVFPRLLSIKHVLLPDSSSTMESIQNLIPVQCPSLENEPKVHFSPCQTVSLQAFQPQHNEMLSALLQRMPSQLLSSISSSNITSSPSTQSSEHDQLLATFSQYSLDIELIMNRINTFQQTESFEKFSQQLPTFCQEISSALAHTSSLYPHQKHLPINALRTIFTLSLFTHTYADVDTLISLLNSRFYSFQATKLLHDLLLLVVRANRVQSTHQLQDKKGIVTFENALHVLSLSVFSTLQSYAAQPHSSSTNQFYSSPHVVRINSLRCALLFLHMLAQIGPQSLHSLQNDILLQLQATTPLHEWSLLSSWPQSHTILNDKLSLQHDTILSLGHFPIIYADVFMPTFSNPETSSHTQHFSFIDTIRIESTSQLPFCTDLECLLQTYPFIFNTAETSNARVFQTEQPFRSHIWGSIMSIPLSFIAPSYPNNLRLQLSPSLISTLSLNTSHSDVISLQNALQIALLSNIQSPFAFPHTFPIQAGVEIDLAALTLSPLIAESRLVPNPLTISRQQQLITAPDRNSTHLPPLSSVFFDNAVFRSLQGETSRQLLEQNGHMVYLTNAMLSSQLDQSDETLTSSALSMTSILPQITIDAAHIITTLLAMGPATRGTYSQPISNIFRGLYTEQQPEINTMLTNPAFSSPMGLQISHLSSQLLSQQHTNSPSTFLSALSVAMHHDVFLKDTTSALRSSFDAYSIAWSNFMGPDVLAQAENATLRQNEQSKLSPSNSPLPSFLNTLLIKSTQGNDALFDNFESSSVPNTTLYSHSFIPTTPFSINIATLTAHRIYNAFSQIVPSNQIQIRHVVAADAFKLAFIHTVLSHWEPSTSPSSLPFYQVIIAGNLHVNAIKRVLIQVISNKQQLQLALQHLRTASTKRPSDDYTQLIDDVKAKIDLLHQLEISLHSYAHHTLDVLLELQTTFTEFVSAPYQNYVSQYQHASALVGVSHQPDGALRFRQVSSVNPSQYRPIIHPYMEYAAAHVGLPIFHQQLYLLSALFSTHGMILSQHADIAFKTAIRCLYRSQQTSHHIKLIQIPASTHSFELRISYLLLSQLGGVNGLVRANALGDTKTTKSDVEHHALSQFSTNGSTTATTTTAQKSYNPRQIPILPALTESPLGIDVQHTFGTNGDTYRAVHFFTIGQNNDAPYLGHLYIDMISNKLMHVNENPLQALQYIDQTIDLWNGNMLASSGQLFYSPNLPITTLASSYLIWGSQIVWQAVSTVFPIDEFIQGWSLHQTKKISLPHFQHLSSQREQQLLTFMQSITPTTTHTSKSLQSVPETPALRFSVPTYLSDHELSSNRIQTSSHPDNSTTAVIYPSILFEQVTSSNTLLSNFFAPLALQIVKHLPFSQISPYSLESHVLSIRKFQSSAQKHILYQIADHTRNVFQNWRLEMYYQAYSIIQSPQYLQYLQQQKQKRYTFSSEQQQQPQPNDPHFRYELIQHLQVNIANHAKHYDMTLFNTHVFSEPKSQDHCHTVLDVETIRLMFQLASIDPLSVSLSDLYYSTMCLFGPDHSIVKALRPIVLEIEQFTIQQEQLTLIAAKTHRRLISSPSKLHKSSVGRQHAGDSAQGKNNPTDDKPQQNHQIRSDLSNDEL